MTRIWIAAALVFAGCSGPPGSLEPSMSSESLGRELTAIGSARVYFGHQSVGADIMRGVLALARDAGVQPPTIMSLQQGRSCTSACWLESLVGENTKPDTKLREFENALGDLAAPVDVALLKFCYTDISADTDVQRLFAQYRDLLSHLGARYPQTVFVPVTTPLKADEGFKGFVKKWARGVDPVAENVRRNRYNDLLRAQYRAETIFDLARIESTRSDGSREIFEIQGRQYERLAATYTTDGGHLSEAGKRATARELVRVLAEVLTSRASRQNQTARR